MLINYAPEPELLACAFHNDLVQIANIAAAHRPSPQVAGDLASALGDPAAGRLR